MIISSNDRADFIIYWEMTGKDNVRREGFHSKFRVNLNPRKDDPIHASIKCDTRVSHNFDSQSRCVIPLELRIKNLSRDQSLSFILSTKSDDGFTWKGKSRHVIRDITPRSIIDLHLKACFSRVGIYDLN